MRKAEEILDKWYTPLHTLEIAKICLIEAMKEYAKEAIEEQLKIAAEEVTTKDDNQGFSYKAYYVVDLDSIINCTRVELI